MDRRKFLQIGAGTVLGSLYSPSLADCAYSNTIYSGWLPNRNASEKFIQTTKRPYLSQQTSDEFNSSGKGQTVLLHKYLEKAIGPIVPHTQKIGDCVGQAYGFAIDILSSTQIYGHGLAETWIAKASTEAIYAGSRYEIGYKVHGQSNLLVRNGSLGVYATEFLRDYGVLVRQKYGEIDLTTYSPSTARDWGTSGVPDELEIIAKQHPVRSFALVRSYNDCRNAIANGYPVVFCSDVGFNVTCQEHNPGGRDGMGFLNQCGKWYHAMAGIAVDDTERPGILVMNSWGPKWVKGPKRLGQPDGSFWVDADTIDSMCAWGDSFTLSGYIGFPAQKLNYNLF